MHVTAHAHARLADRLGTLSDDIVARLEAMVGVAGEDLAIEVHRHARAVRDGTGSNGDSVVVIAREGSVETVMLRRSWNQPFTAIALGVDRVARLVQP